MMPFERYLAAVCITAASMTAVGAAETEQAVDIAIIAAQIRSQGYSCANPTSAESIAAESGPNEPVYLLRCENASYKVRLVPDQAAKVTLVE